MPKRKSDHPGNILVVEDEPDMGLAIKNLFEEEGFLVHVAQTGKEGLQRLKEELPSLILLDLKLPDISGMEVLGKMKKKEPEVPVIMLTGYGEIETAVQAIKKGAFHFLCKPFQKVELLLLVKKAMDESRRSHEIEVLHQRLNQNREARYALGRSPCMHEVFKQIEKIAPTDMTVILQGESGAGKEVMARILHEKSDRRNMPYIALDCGTLPEALVESELYGYEPGAFTGADKRKLGQFELANGGTIFLDEIGNLTPLVQAKLLRVVQERRVQHLGGKREIAIDVRIVVASNRNLQDEVGKGRFREDLYHRLNEFTLTIPPLRERREDIPELVEIFLQEARMSLRKKIKGISNPAMILLQNYPWPGNVRQLRNTIRAAALLAEDTVDSEHVRTIIAKDQKRGSSLTTSGRNSLKKVAHKAEKEMILEALHKTSHNKARAARLLKIDRTVLYDKIRKFKIPLEIPEK